MTRDQFKREALSRAMKKHGWNQSGLALALGLPVNTVHCFLAGRANSLNIAIRICLKLNMPITWAYQTCEQDIPEEIQDLQPEAASDA